MRPQTRRTVEACAAFALGVSMAAALAALGYWASSPRDGAPLVAAGFAAAAALVMGYRAACDILG